MYHYLKWAAFSFFLKRNIRYLILMLIALLGIYGTIAVYRDLAEYFIAVEQKESLLTLLLAKWIVLLIFGALFVASVMSLGLKSEAKGRKKDSDKEAEIEERIAARLKKFQNRERLKCKSDLLIERMKKHGKS